MQKLVITSQWPHIHSQNSLVHICCHCSSSCPCPCLCQSHDCVHGVFGLIFMFILIRNFLCSSMDMQRVHVQWDRGLKHGHSPWTCSIGMHGHEAAKCNKQHRNASRPCIMETWTWNMVMWDWHQNGHAKWTYMLKKQYVHAAWIFSIDMQHGHASWTCCIEWTCIMGMQNRNENASWTCSKDIYIKHRHRNTAQTWTYSMDVDKQHAPGRTGWTCTIQKKIQEPNFISLFCFRLRTASKFGCIFGI